jgi:hypothetical protein
MGKFFGGFIVMMNEEQKVTLKRRLSSMVDQLGLTEEEAELVLGDPEVVKVLLVDFFREVIRRKSVPRDCV